MIATTRPDGSHPIVNERPQHAEHRAEHRQAALEAARRADAKERPHPEAKIEASHISGCRSRLRFPMDMRRV